jgi:two-component system chemotaxis response regulator CheB
MSAQEKRSGVASGLTCPDCHGSLWELDEGPVPRIECRVGHAFSIDAFLGKQAVALEEAIWSAINSLEERAMALRRFADRLGQTSRMKDDYQERADLVASQALLLRDGLVRVIQAEEHGVARSSNGGLVHSAADPMAGDV